MTSKFTIKKEKYVALSVAALYHEAFLPNIITRTDGNVFKGAKGDAVYYDLPGITRARDYEWRTRTAPIQFDEIYRTKLSFILNKQTYSGVSVTDEQLTLDVESFNDDVVLPQSQALGTKLDGKILTALQAAPWKITNIDAATADDPFVYALSVQAKLDAQGTPKGNRFLLVGSNVQPWMYACPKIATYDPEQAKTVFREGVFGRLAGMDIVGTSFVGANDIVALHQSWGLLANVAPAVPAGVPYAASKTFQNYGVRILRMYSLEYLRDRSVLSTFTGITSVNDEYARWTAATIAAANGAAGPLGQNLGAVAGEVIIGDGTAGAEVSAGPEDEPVFTGKNIRGARGVFTP